MYPSADIKRLKKHLFDLHIMTEIPEKFAEHKPTLQHSLGVKV